MRSMVAGGGSRSDWGVRFFDFFPPPERGKVAKIARREIKPGEGPFERAALATPHPLRSRMLAQHPLPQGEREKEIVSANTAAHFVIAGRGYSVMLASRGAPIRQSMLSRTSAWTTGS